MKALYLTLFFIMAMSAFLFYDLTKHNTQINVCPCQTLSKRIDSLEAELYASDQTHFKSIQALAGAVFTLQVSHTQTLDREVDILKAVSEHQQPPPPIVVYRNFESFFLDIDSSIHYDSVFSINPTGP